MPERSVVRMEERERSPMRQATTSPLDRFVQKKRFVTAPLSWPSCSFGGWISDTDFLMYSNGDYHLPRWSESNLFRWSVSARSPLCHVTVDQPISHQTVVPGMSHCYLITGSSIEARSCADLSVVDVFTSPEHAVLHGLEIDRSATWMLVSAEDALYAFHLQSRTWQRIMSGRIAARFLGKSRNLIALDRVGTLSCWDIERKLFVWRTSERPNLESWHSFRASDCGTCLYIINNGEAIRVDAADGAIVARKPIPRATANSTHIFGATDEGFFCPFIQGQKLQFFEWQTGIARPIENLHDTRVVSWGEGVPKAITRNQVGHLVVADIRHPTSLGESQLLGNPRPGILGGSSDDAGGWWVHTTHGLYHLHPDGSVCRQTPDLAPLASEHWQQVYPFRKMNVGDGLTLGTTSYPISGTHRIVAFRGGHMRVVETASRVDGPALASPSLERIVFTQGGSLTLNGPAGQVSRQLRPSALAWLPDGNILAITMQDAYALHRDTLEDIRTWPGFGTDGETLVQHAPEWGLSFWQTDAGQRLLNPSGNHIVWQPLIQIADTTWLRYEQAGNRLVRVGDDGGCSAVPLSSDAALTRLVAYDGTCERLLSSGPEGCLEQWCLKTRTRLARHYLFVDGWVTEVGKTPHCPFGAIRTDRPDILQVMEAADGSAPHILPHGDPQREAFLKAYVNAEAVAARLAGGARIGTPRLPGSDGIVGHLA